MNQDIEQTLDRLQRSAFRQRFRLGDRERNYYREKGREVIERHAWDFIGQRLAPALPRNDGKQTPMRNHPVFIAQHATATCCRGCLEKWHHIPRGREMDTDERRFAVALVMAWLSRQP